MINFNRNLISNALRIIIALVFILSGLTKLFPIHLTELNLVYHHIANWNYSPYLTRILIIAEIVLGLALLFGVSYKKWTLYAAITFLGLFSVYLIILLLNEGNNQNCGCFGSVIPMTPLESLFKNIILILILMLIIRTAHPNNSKVRTSLFLLLGLSSSIVILIYFPIYTWLNVDPVPNKTVPFDFIKPITFKPKGTVNLKEGNKLIAVFNMACNNCRELAFKLGIIAKQKKIDNLYLMLVGEPDEIDDFIKETHLHAPYVRYTFFEFIKLYPHSTWPWIILTEEGKIKKQWIYETFDVKNFLK